VITLNKFKSTPFITIASLNLAAIILLLWRVKVVDNDKAPLLMIFLYPLLIVINLIVLWILKIVKNDFYKVQVTIIKSLFILIIPLFMIAFEL